MLGPLVAITSGRRDTQSGARLGPRRKIFECANTAARRTFRGDIVDLWRLMDSDGRLVRPTDEEIASAWDEFERGGAASPAVVDLISFQVMRRLGLARAFTNDRHFRAAGFETLIQEDVRSGESGVIPHGPLTCG